MGRRRPARGLSVLLVLAGVAGACGSEERPDRRAAESPAASTGDAEAPAEVGRIDVALDQPSVLDLLDARGEHGTFTVSFVVGEPVETTHTVTGRYVATAAGPSFTVVDLDLSLVRAEVARLLAEADRFDSIEPLLADAVLSSDTVVTDQLQAGLGDLLLASGLLGASGYLAATPWLAFTAVEAGDLETCRGSLEDLRTAVRARLLEDQPLLGSSWSPDPARLGGQEAAAAEAACDGLEQADWPVATLTIEADALRVSFDDMVWLTAEVHPGAGEPLVVDSPMPAPLLDGFGTFFLAIDRCGGLPWMYSSFAAANSYTPPDSPGYIGPTPLGGSPVCEAEVPDR